MRPFRDHRSGPTSAVGLAGVIAGLAIAGCAPTPVAWQRIDLVSPAPYRVTAPAGQPEWDAGSAPIKTPLIGREDARAFLQGGAYEALSIPVGGVVGWNLELPEEAFLRARPMRVELDGCRYHYRFRIADAAAGRGGASLEPRAAADLDPSAPLHLDLGRYGGRAITLQLAVAATGDHCATGNLPPGVLASPAIYGRVERTPPPGRDRPNVLLIAFDAMRADDLGAWGRRPSLTPALDALAAESDVYRWAFSTFNATNPSFASIFTGRYGKNHGVYDLVTPLDSGHTTLAEILGAAGWSTHAILGARHLADQWSGLAQGFAGYRVPARQAAAEAVVEDAMDWIQVQDRPFFLWLHLFDPHTPHRPPAPFDAGRRHRRAWGLASVDEWTPERAPGVPRDTDAELGASPAGQEGELAYLDRQIDRLEAFLRSRGLLETTIVVVLSDHGEDHGEHGRKFIHTGLWDSTTHVPLMIRWPAAAPAGRVFDGLVQTIDVFPTLLDALGLDDPAPPRDGLPLAGPAPAAVPTTRRYVFAEHANHLGTMVRDQRFLFHRLVPGPHSPAGRRLYELRTDADQVRDRAAELAPTAEAAERLLDRWLAERLADFATAPPSPLGDEDRAQLRALGYATP